jgi:hypothetical protein
MDPSHRTDRVSARSSAASLGLALAGLLASCDHAPSHAPMHYTLSTATKTSLASAPEVQDQMLGSLEMLFGTPQNPSYLRTKDWVDAEFDPNHAELAADAGGTGEVSESEMNGVKADNLVRFKGELEQVARRDYAGLADFKSAPHLSERVAAIVADSQLAEDKRQAELKELFEYYYPSLRDSTELYRQQCLHCHGVEGGGDGPTAGSVEHPVLYPRPRDYRLGKFKFTAVKD